MSKRTDEPLLGTMSTAVLSAKIRRHKNTVRSWAQCSLIRCHKRNSRVIFFVGEEVEADMKKNHLHRGDAE